MKNLIIVTLIFIFHAQSYGQSFVSGPYTDKFIGQPIVADFNGDQKVDVIGASKFFSLEGDLKLHVNTSQSGIISFETVDLALEIFGNPGFGDFDRDNDVDLIVTAVTDSTVLILLNNGDGTFQQHPQIAGPAYNFRSGDLDGDQDIDIVSFNEYDSRAYLLFNDGNGEFLAVNLIVNEEDLQTIELGDIDGDSDTDIIVGYDYFFDAKIVLFENNGSGIFNEETITDFAIGGLENIQVVDIDKDDDADIVYSSYDFSYLRILANDGNQEFLESNLVQAEGDIRSFNVTDYNTDGIMDIIIGCDDDDNTYHQGQQSGSLAFDSEIITGITGIFYIVNGDLDSDNDLDAVLTNGDFWWIRNELEQFYVSTADVKDLTFDIYPNPFTNYIEIALGVGDKAIAVSDIYGRVLFRSHWNNQTLDLNFLDKGIYFLTVVDQKTFKLLQSSRIIKIE